MSKAVSAAPNFWFHPDSSNTKLDNLYPSNNVSENLNFLKNFFVMCQKLIQDRECFGEGGLLKSSECRHVGEGVGQIII